MKGQKKTAGLGGISTATAGDPEVLLDAADTPAQAAERKARIDARPAQERSEWVEFLRQQANDAEAWLRLQGFDRHGRRGRPVTLDLNVLPAPAEHRKACETYHFLRYVRQTLATCENAAPAVIDALRAAWHGGHLWGTILAMDANSPEVRDVGEDMLALNAELKARAERGEYPDPETWHAIFAKIRRENGREPLSRGAFRTAKSRALRRPGHEWLGKTLPNP